MPRKDKKRDRNISSKKQSPKASVRSRKQSRPSPPRKNKTGSKRKTGNDSQSRQKQIDFLRRSRAAKLGWKRRRERERTSSRNQEYILTVIETGKKRRQAREWDLLAITKKDQSDSWVIHWVANWIERHKPSLMWIVNLMEKAKIIVAPGPYTNKKRGVWLR